MSRDILRELQQQSYHHEVERVMNTELHTCMICWVAGYPSRSQLSDSMARAILHHFGFLSPERGMPPYSLRMRCVAVGWWGVWLPHDDERWTIRTGDLHRLLEEAERCACIDAVLGPAGGGS